MNENTNVRHAALVVIAGQIFNVIEIKMLVAFPFVLGVHCVSSFSLSS